MNGAIARFFERQLGVWRAAGVVLVLGIFSFALWKLHGELRSVRYHDVLDNVRALPRPALFGAIALTAISYLILTLYDAFGLRYAKKPLPYPQTALASFVSYVFSHNLGLAVFSATAFRYRIYSTFGLSAVDVARVVAFCGATFWLGLAALGGGVLALYPPAAGMLGGWAPLGFRLLGVVLFAGAVAYILASFVVHRPLKIMRWEISLPAPKIALTQLGLSILDWTASSLVMYLFLEPVLHVDFSVFLSIYVLASVAGVISHVPAGVGVVESVFLTAFSGLAPPQAILGALLAYRATYYLGPLALGLTLVFGFETGGARSKVAPYTNVARRWLAAIVPQLFAFVTFATGVVLLFSSAVPAIEARRHWLKSALPLELVEASHLFSSLTGAALLVVARGLLKRLDGAWLMTVILLSAAIVFSLLKGVDYEEALIAAGALALLLPCRSQFRRRASLLEQPFSTRWLTATALTLISMIWLVLFAYKHVEYRSELWYTFTFKGDAPRALRASVGAVSVALIFGILQLLRPPRGTLVTKSARPDEKARSVIRQSDRTYPHLALLGDKAILSNESGNAFVMYGTEGRSWIAMGDPVGPEDERQELIWEFRDLCDRYGGWPVFYQVDQSSLHQYVEAGLSLVKIGEEALVDLAPFTLEGKSQKSLRNIVNRMAKDGFTFGIEPEASVPALLPELRRISDAWMSHKSVREKGFSLGYFDDDYLREGPMALVRKGEQIVAFANVWQTELKAELSVDLMRYSEDAPPGVMDYLFVELMLWGKANGFQTFNLGMAPMSGMENRPLAPLWSRLGAALYAYGEHFYNFQGLREYKEKFHPRWQGKYIASPAGLALPLILANVATLISGGVKGAIGK